MVVIITQKIKKRTRNFLKRWFIEPKCNVFIGDIDFERIKLIIDYINKINIKEDFNALIIASTNSIQKYKIIEIGNTKVIKNKITITGIELIKEKALLKFNK